MPVIARFFGIIIKMFFIKKEHQPPHIHVVYGEYNATFDIQTGEMLEGDLSPRAKALVQEWIGQHCDELLEMWNSQKFKTLPPLE
ncbi:MAG: DUF4160 domain-containing protein [Alphaproteobacteria bacterium]|nr:DUF4160 domain-containing protein [Alphaproteobacteria bacterium]